MKRLTTGLFPALLTLAFLARGAAAFCPPKASDHACCDKPAPAAPQTPCPEMACCRVVPATVAPALTQLNDLVADLAPVIAPPVPVKPPLVVPSSSDSGPPGPRVRFVCDRSPPARLG